jgi:transposase-like protein
MGTGYFPVQSTVVLNRLYMEFLATGRCPSRQQTKGNIPEHYHNYRVLGVDTGDLAEPDPNTAITATNTRLVAYCSVHDWRFVTTIRFLFSTANELMRRTKCPACQGAVTVAAVRERLLQCETVDFVLDEENLPKKFRNPHQPVLTKDELPVVCRHNRFGSDEPCGERRRHRWNNLRTLLEKDPHFLNCQGPCDSTTRGKSQRAEREIVAQEILDARAGTWRMLEDSAYRKKAEECWITHMPCGGEVLRMPATIINYPTRNGVAADTMLDCPYCMRESAYHTIGGNPAALGFWVDYITDGNVRLKNSEIFPGSADAIPVVCNRCESGYIVTQQQLRSNVHFGCKVCYICARKQLRAWVLADAKELVAKRGFTLVADPQSYTAPATILTAAGKAVSVQTIEDFLNAYPVKPPPGTSIGKLKRRYALNDDAFVRITPNASYFAGLIASDGWVVGTKLKIALQAVDEDVLGALLGFVGGNHPVRYQTRSLVEGRNTYAELVIGSAKILVDLDQNFGIRPNKSLTQPAPVLPEDCIIPYLVGLIEGDGSVRIHQKMRYKPLSISLVCASEALIQWVHRTICALIDTLIPPPYPHVRGDSERNTVWKITVMRENAEKLGEKLLNYPGTMLRKWVPLNEHLVSKREAKELGQLRGIRQNKFAAARQAHAGDSQRQ